MSRVLVVLSSASKVLVEVSEAVTASGGSNPKEEFADLSGLVSDFLEGTF